MGASHASRSKGVRALALMKKGLRRDAALESGIHAEVRALALMKKGLRPAAVERREGGPLVRALALMKKGLRLPLGFRFAFGVARSSACPDEEGIETVHFSNHVFRRLLFERLPW